MKTKRIGIYGGSFDPIHLGHLSLAIEMMERHHLHSVLFCPTFTNPFKNEKDRLLVHHCEAMVRLAIKGIKGLGYSRVDLDRPGPSYTVDTLRILHEQEKNKNQNVSFYLILGEDSAETFFDWHQPQEILKLATVVVGRRSILTKTDEKNGLNKALQQGCTPTRYLEISSTEIRQRIQAGLHIEHLVPEPVWRYIKRHRLYE